MDFGIALGPGADAWKTVKRAEELGLHAAWLYDSQLLYADVFVALALAARETSRIRLGTGVLIPSNRIAPVAASGVAALNALAPGRIDLGVGTGFTGRRTMGLGAMKLGDLDSYVDVVRTMLRDEIAELEVEGRTRKVRFLNPELGLVNTRDPIPVHLSAFGPRGRRLAALRYEGWMTFSLDPADAVRQLGEVHASCGEAGRDPATLYTTAFTLGCILEEGEPADSPRARAQAGPLAAVALHNFVETEERGSIVPLPPELRGVVDAYKEVYAGYEPADARYLTLHRGHLLFVRPEEERFLSADLLRSFTLTGTREELLEKLRGFRDAGYDQFTLQLVPGHESALEGWVELFAKV